MDRYSHFNVNAAMLAPEAWCRRTRFNLETLEPVEVRRLGEHPKVSRLFAFGPS